MKKSLTILCSVLLFTACKEIFEDRIANKNSTIINKKKNFIWVWIEIETIYDNKLSTDNYYGRLEETDLRNFEEKNESSELIKINSLRYYSNNNLVPYEDSLYTGSMFIRTENIRRIEILKKDPLNKYNLHYFNKKSAVFHKLLII